MRCDCGAVVLTRCWDVNARPPMTACTKPLCRADCPKHRHEPNTMGYMTVTVTGHYSGFVSDDGGLLDWLRCLWRHYTWSAVRKAQYVWDELVAATPPPAPLSDFFFVVGKRTFISRNGALKLEER